jgi:signal transduction histidine kinase
MVNTTGWGPSSLHELLKARRDDVVARWSHSIQSALAPGPLPRAELLDRVTAFVDEIVAALHPGALTLPGFSENAGERGAQRLRLGFDAAEVVREYGLLHDCVLQLAAEVNLQVSPREHQALAKRVNAGIADAIVEYGEQRDAELERQASEHLGFMAHELRNPLAAGLLAVQRLRKTAGAGPGVASTIDILERNLRRTGGMIDNALSKASPGMGVEPSPTRLGLRHFLQEIVSDSEGEARARHIETVVTAPPTLIVHADPRLLRSAVANLVHNALKFSHEYSRVAVRGRAADGWVVIEVEDACGGLPPGKAEELFAPSVQRGQDRSGFGFGLTIARQAVEAQHGTIRVRDLPGTGCAFSVELPVAAARSS